MIADRIRLANDRPLNSRGKYVLYWSQMFRRLHSNHALDHAIAIAAEQKKALVVYEALKLNYPWANARHHTFILQGMRDNARVARELGLTYWPFVETEHDRGRGLVKRLASEAVCLITDDYPGYIVPAHNRAIAAACNVSVRLVDGNCIVPLARLGPTVGAAAHLRPRIHKQFGEAWQFRAARIPRVPASSKGELQPPFATWDPEPDIAHFVAALPIDQSVRPVPGVQGGSVSGRQALGAFVAKKLRGYAEGRNEPNAPARTAASGLSPYLHYGHISIQEVAEAVLGADWTPQQINSKTRNKDDFFCRDANVNSFLDEAITWRDLGYHWHFSREAPESPSTVSWTSPVGTGHSQEAPGRPTAVSLLAGRIRGRRNPRPALERRPAGVERDRADPQLFADAVGKKSSGVEYFPRGCLRNSRTSEQQVCPRWPRSEFVHGHSLVFRIVRSAVAAGTKRVWQRPLHVVRKHGPKVRSQRLLRVRPSAARSLPLTIALDPDTTCFLDKLVSPTQDCKHE
jgi:deoxyribodipyrimidine photolyase